MHLGYQAVADTEHGFVDCARTFLLPSLAVSPAGKLGTASPCRRRHLRPNFQPICCRNHGRGRRKTNKCPHALGGPKRRPGFSYFHDPDWRAIRCAAPDHTNIVDPLATGPSLYSVTPSKGVGKAWNFSLRHSHLHRWADFGHIVLFPNLLMLCLALFARRSFPVR